MDKAMDVLAVLLGLLYVLLIGFPLEVLRNGSKKERFRYFIIAATMLVILKTFLGLPATLALGFVLSNVIFGLAALVSTVLLAAEDNY